MTDIATSSQGSAPHSRAVQAPPAPHSRDLPAPATAGRESRGGRAPRRGGVLLAIVLAAQFMALLDASIVNVAIPTIQASLHASGASLQLVVAGCTISPALVLVDRARPGD